MSEVTQPEDVKHPPPPVVDRLAARAADRAATVWFLTANLMWWLTWLPSNGYGTDGGGSFGILTLLLSFEAIVLTVAVLIQNRLDAAARDRQAEADLKNNAIAAQLTEEISSQLGRVEALLTNGNWRAR